MKSAIILVRVSTAIQDFEPQLVELERFAQAKGFTKLHRIHTKESGLADVKNKKGLHELFSFIEDNPEFKTIFATELSRLARRQSILHEIKEWLLKNKIQLHLKDTGYALYDELGQVSAAGEIMFTLYGYFAESEIKTKKDRFLRSRKYLMELGFSISGKTLFGYKRTEIENNKTTLIPHEDNAETVKEIYRWYLHGIDDVLKNPSIKSIALHCILKGKEKYTHSKRNINKLLKEEAYTGEKITNNKRKNPNFIEGSELEKYIISNNRIKYPKIIERELFESVQQKLKTNNTQADKSSKHITLLSRKIRCQNCGNYFISQFRFKSKQDKSTYRCGSRTRVNGCPNKTSISLSLIDSAVWGLICSDIESLKKIYINETPDEKLTKLSNEKSNILKSIEEINSSIEGFKLSLSRYSRNQIMINAAFVEVEKLDKQKSVLEKKLDEINSDIFQIQNHFNSIDFLQVNEFINSKYLIKKFIDLFVKEIVIKFQNTRFSIIQVSFRATSHEIKHGRQIANLDDGILEPINTIVLDKRVTQSVRAFSITSYVRVIPRNLQIDLPVGVARINGRLRPNFQSINLVNLGNTESEFAKEFSLKKIDL